MPCYYFLHGSLTSQSVDIMYTCAIFCCVAQSILVSSCPNGSGRQNQRLVEGGDHLEIPCVHIDNRLPFQGDRGRYLFS